MYRPVEPARMLDFKGCKLVLPCVSVGNVAQLTVDLLVATLKMEHIGHLYDECFLPLVCHSAFDHTRGAVSTSAEVYMTSDQQLVVVQLRSPIAKGKEKRFVKLILDWIKAACFSDLVILTTTYAHERLDQQITSGCSCRFVTAPTFPHYKHLTDELGWILLEKRQPEGRDELFLPGGGVAKLMYQESITAEVRVTLLIKFTSQGDNSSDARELADYFNQWVMIKQPTAKWSTPTYWSLMFGNPTPPDIY
ncbi:proteasome assembly chaperone 2-like [Dysidea avara]|uniref:proteasome assembly chaperone 2-like n=1 Tax=Dysidea avara TaxID=196820 RepID=UPI00331C2D66